MNVTLKLAFLLTFALILECESHLQTRKRSADGDEANSPEPNLPPLSVLNPAKPLADGVEAGLDFLKTMVAAVKNATTDLLKPLQGHINKLVKSFSVSSRRKRSVTLNCAMPSLSCPKAGLYRFNQSCTQFYECYFSPECNRLIPRLYTCPKCLKFNAKKQICDLPDNVPECSYSHLGPKKFCTAEGKYFVPDDCSKYYECEAIDDSDSLIMLTIKKCPSGMTFSHKDLKCVENNRCNLARHKCKTGKTYSGDKFDCGKYHYCVNGAESTEMNCPAGSVFDGEVCVKMESSPLSWFKVKQHLQRGKNSV